MRQRAVAVSTLLGLVVAAGCGDGPTGARSDAAQPAPSSAAISTDASPAPSSTEPGPSAPDTEATSSTTVAAPSFSNPTELEPFPFETVVDLGVSAGRLRQGNGALFAVWPGRDTVYRIDPRTAVVSGEVDLPGEPNPDVGTFLGSYAGDLWAMNGALDHLQRIDATTLTVEAEIAMPTPGPSGNYWIQAGEQPLVNGYGDDEVVHLVDPATNTVVATHQIPKADASHVAFDSIWVSNIERGTVTRIRLDAAEDRTVIDVGGTPGIIATTEDTVWVLDRRNASITPIDPATNRADDAIVLAPGASSGIVSGFAESPTGSIIVTVEANNGPQLAGIAVIDADTRSLCQAGLLPDGALPGGLQTIDDAVYMLLVSDDEQSSNLARLDLRC